MRPLKRSFSINGHRTSISLETPFWEALKEIACTRTLTLAALVAEIDNARADGTGLSTAVRLYVLADLQERVRGR
ncbi:MAG: ribbon-helix-helix domain-containing protein [Hyphomicrobiaceae bacterium]|nr:ribbon-helix-helix domain-containing protein [Hyphomicrobiaceae bacterium]MCC0011313.1 ribbon-helix-helix domain-containing protein [Hyphomicrobiaceae bacterium]